MPHVELSLIESRRLPRARQPGSALPGSPARPDYPLPANCLHRWANVVTCAAEPSLLLDAQSFIVAASTAAAEMLGCGVPASAEGRQLRDAVTHLVDFTEPPDKLDSAETGKIPPLLAISSGRLARGLMRVRCPQSGQSCTMDAIATPLWQDDRVIGSLSFFSKV